MKNSLLIFIVSFAICSLSHAAKPKSIKYIEEIFIDDTTTYVYYQVTCTNKKRHDLSAWNDKKLWCEGKGIKDVCNKKKVKSAKKLCKKK